MLIGYNSLHCFNGTRIEIIDPAEDESIEVMVFDILSKAMEVLHRSRTSLCLGYAQSFTKGN